MIGITLLLSIIRVIRVMLFCNAIYKCGLPAYACAPTLFTFFQILFLTLPTLMCPLR